LLSGAFYILYTPKHGVPDNGLIVPVEKVMSYYESLIVGFLDDENINDLPVLKCSCMKFIFVYRN